MLNNLINHVKMKGVYDQHAAETIAHDVLLDKNSKGSEFKNANFRVLNYFRDTNRWYDRTLPLEYSAEDGASLLDVIPYDDYNEGKSAQQEAQRHLIDALVDGSDERTKLIVQTFLESDKPTPTNVAKRLGLDHKQVSRALKKLASKYSEEEFGDLEDYFKETSDSLTV